MKSDAYASNPFVKMGWQRFATRKDKLETIAGEGMGLTPSQAAEAWYRLMEKMIDLSSPEAPRIPKFNDVLLSVVAGIVRGRKAPAKYEDVPISVLPDCDSAGCGSGFDLGRNSRLIVGSKPVGSQIGMAPEHLP